MTNTATFRIMPGQTVNGVASAARSIPASLLIATRREIKDALSTLPIGGVVSFEAGRGRAADLGGSTAVTVQRTA